MSHVVVRSVGNLEAAVARALASGNDYDIAAGTKAEPDVSVIMRVYNSSKNVAEAIDSIVDQDYGGIIELVVVYSRATSDGSLKAMLPGMKRLLHRGGSARVLLRSHNGPFRAYQEGLAAAKGRYVASLDSDNFYYPNKLSRQIAFMEKTGASFSFTAYQAVDKYGKPIRNVLPLAPRNYKDFSQLVSKYYVDMNTVVMGRRFRNLMLDAFRCISGSAYDRCFEDYLMGMIASLRGELEYLGERLNAYRIWEGNFTMLNSSTPQSNFDATAKLMPYVQGTFAALLRINSEMRLTDKKILLGTRLELSGDPLSISFRRKGRLAARRSSK